MKNELGIDVETRDKNRLIKRLAKLKSTQLVEDGGIYQEDTSYSQVHITTDWSEDELDDWLYKVNHQCEYVGVWERKS